MRLTLPLAASFALFVSACEAAHEASSEVIPIHLAERPVVVGEVLEELGAPGSPYVYIRVTQGERHERWVALPREASEQVRVGERVRVRSLGGRSHVWVGAIEREFEWLEYGAMLDR